MNKGPLDLVHWLAGFDLAGLGAIIEVDHYLEAVTTDVTPLGPMGAFEHEAPLGRVKYMLNEAGYVRDRQESLRRVLQSGAPATPWRDIFGHEGGDIGALVTLATDMQIRKYSLVPDIGDILKADIGYYLAPGGDVFEEAQLLAHGVVKNVTDVGQTPGSAYRLDLGASHDEGAVICIMADILGSRWRGYDEIHFRLRHSASAGTGYANLGSQIQWDRGDDGQTLIEIASGTTINRYVALRFTFSAPRDTFALQGAHSSGATDITVDAVAGEERIEEGDRLLISTQTYTAESAGETSTPGTWEITLTSGLQSNVADNTSVTLTGSNVSLRYAAAIHLN